MDFKNIKRNFYLSLDDTLIIFTDAYASIPNVKPLVFPKNVTGLYNALLSKNLYLKCQKRIFRLRVFSLFCDHIKNDYLVF